MRIIGREEIEALLRATPETPQNAQLLDMLYQLRRDTSIVRYPYSYTANFAALGVGATATVNVNIDAAAPFLIVNQTLEADVAGASVTVSTRVSPNVSVLLTDTSSNRQMSDAAVAAWNIFGNGQFPYILPEPKLMAANSVLQVQVTSFEAAVTPVLRFAFNGYKLYSLGGG